jgi:hypothetical protein
MLEWMERGSCVCVCVCVCVCARARARVRVRVVCARVCASVHSGHTLRASVNSKGGGTTCTHARGHADGSRGRPRGHADARTCTETHAAIRVTHASMRRGARTSPPASTRTRTLSRAHSRAHTRALTIARARVRARACRRTGVHLEADDAAEGVREVRALGYLGPPPVVHLRRLRLLLQRESGEERESESESESE